MVIFLHSVYSSVRKKAFDLNICIGVQSLFYNTEPLRVGCMKDGKDLYVQGIKTLLQEYETAKKKKVAKTGIGNGSNTFVFMPAS